jgi:hypothetical protein
MQHFHIMTPAGLSFYQHLETPLSIAVYPLEHVGFYVPFKLSSCPILRSCDTICGDEPRGRPQSLVGGLNFSPGDHDDTAGFGSTAIVLASVDGDRLLPHPRRRDVYSLRLLRYRWFGGSLWSSSIEYQAGNLGRRSFQR